MCTSKDILSSYKHFINFVFFLSNSEIPLTLKSFLFFFLNDGGRNFCHSTSFPSRYVRHKLIRYLNEPKTHVSTLRLNIPSLLCLTFPYIRLSVMSERITAIKVWFFDERYFWSLNNRWWFIFSINTEKIFSLSFHSLVRLRMISNDLTSGRKYFSACKLHTTLTAEINRNRSQFSLFESFFPRFSHSQ